jgi:argininosuccinate lyase
MTYNRDLQEDKERLFDTCDTVRATLRLNAGMLRETHINIDVCKTAASDPTLIATDLADYLVRKGVPFRHAHHAVGAVVAAAEKQNKKLNQLTLADYQNAHKGFGPDVLEVFDLNKAMKARALTGAPGSGEVKRQLRAWRKRL